MALPLPSPSPSPTPSKKNKTKRKHIYHALQELEKNNQSSYLITVRKLKKENPDNYNRLTVDGLKTWNYRFPKGEKRELLILINPDGYREKKILYPELRELLKDEIGRREKKNLLRDRETLLMWAQDKAEELASTDPKYKQFKG